MSRDPRVELRFRLGTRRGSARDVDEGGKLLTREKLAKQSSLSGASVRTARRRSISAAVREVLDPGFAAKRQSLDQEPILPDKLTSNNLAMRQRIDARRRKRDFENSHIDTVRSTNNAPSSSVTEQAQVTVELPNEYYQVHAYAIGVNGTAYLGQLKGNASSATRAVYTPTRIAALRIEEILKNRNNDNYHLEEDNERPHIALIVGTGIPGTMCLQNVQQRHIERLLPADEVDSENQHDVGKQKAVKRPSLSQMINKRVKLAIGSSEKARALSFIQSLEDEVDMKTASSQTNRISPGKINRGKGNGASFTEGTFEEAVATGAASATSLISDESEAAYDQKNKDPGEERGPFQGQDEVVEGTAEYQADCSDGTLAGNADGTASTTAKVRCPRFKAAYRISDFCGMLFEHAAVLKRGDVKESKSEKKKKTEMSVLKDIKGRGSGVSFYEGTFAEAAANRTASARTNISELESYDEESERQEAASTKLQAIMRGRRVRSTIAGSHVDISVDNLGTVDAKENSHDITITELTEDADDAAFEAFLNSTLDKKKQKSKHADSEKEESLASITRNLALVWSKMSAVEKRPFLASNNDEISCANSLEEMKESENNKNEENSSIDALIATQEAAYAEEQRQRKDAYELEAQKEKEEAGKIAAQAKAAEERQLREIELAMKKNDQIKSYTCVHSTGIAYCNSRSLRDEVHGMQKVKYNQKVEPDGDADEDGWFGVNVMGDIFYLKVESEGEVYFEATTKQTKVKKKTRAPPATRPSINRTNSRTSSSERRSTIPLSPGGRYPDRNSSASARSLSTPRSTSRNSSLERAAAARNSGKRRGASVGRSQAPTAPLRAFAEQKQQISGSGASRTGQRSPSGKRALPPSNRRARYHKQEDGTALLEKMINKSSHEESFSLM